MATCELPGNVAFGSRRFSTGESTSNPWVEEVNINSSVDLARYPSPEAGRRNNSCVNSLARSPWQGSVVAEQPRSGSCYLSNQAEACPILPTDWRPASAPVSTEYPNTRAEREKSFLSGGKPGAGSGTFSAHQQRSSSPTRNNNASSKSPIRALGLREQLLRASSIPTPQDVPEGVTSAAQPRRKSSSFLCNQTPSEQLVQQQLSYQLQHAELQWRQAEAEAEAEDDAIFVEGEDSANAWLEPTDGLPADVLNWTEVEELCANMDIAGMRVEDVDILCPSASCRMYAGQAETDTVLLALKFEGMAIRQYPGNPQAKFLFSEIVGR